MTAPTISTLPTAPSRGSAPSVFVPTADNWVAALPTFGSDANVMAVWMNYTAAAVAADDSSAAASAAAALASESAAAGSAAFKGLWSGLTGALNVPSTVLHNSRYWVLLNNLADVTASEPGVTADWARLHQNKYVRVTAISLTAVEDDHVHVTASGQTITLPASPAAGDEVTVSVGDFTDTVIGRNGLNIMSAAENMTLDRAYAGITLRYIDAARGWNIV